MTEATTQPMTPDQPQRLAAEPGSALVAACALMSDNIGDTSMDAAWNEWMKGEWRGKNAPQLRVGDIMRDESGDGVKITGIYPAEDCFYVTAEGNRTCQVPRKALVLVKPNDSSSDAARK